MLLPATLYKLPMPVQVTNALAQTADEPWQVLAAGQVSALYSIKPSNPILAAAERPLLPVGKVGPFACTRSSAPLARCAAHVTNPAQRCAR